MAVINTKLRDEIMRKKLFGNRYKSFKCKKCKMINGSRILGRCLYCGEKI